MQITKLEEGASRLKHDTKVFTQEELQKEFDFILAEKIVRKMAEKGLISDDELHKISEKNRLIFSPYLSEIYQ
ncbi:SHOCT domain-containing protein [Catenibacterium sp. co_0103]|uniref:SHOCT domain-containing protein n=1 Tax=Catenibacterium sp. co_0103 TaxID=2478954 RepID=UPI00247AF0C6|nr:SHOCT domain-containing protein [Catenibacterium sp. co_0103]